MFCNSFSYKILIRNTKNRSGGFAPQTPLPGTLSPGPLLVRTILARYNKTTAVLYYMAPVQYVGLLYTANEGRNSYKKSFINAYLRKNFRGGSAPYTPDRD